MLVTTNKKTNLKRLLSPHKIALVGSKDILSQAIQNCKRIGFPGEIYVVHRSEKEIEGYSCYPSVSELPETPDAAFISVRGEKTIEVVRDLEKLGTPGCVCYAAGFSEIGAHDLQNQLVEAAGDMALIGPNCYGMINFIDQVALWPDRFGGTPVEKGAVIISQSGNISLNLTLSDRSIPLAYVISVGNQAVLSIEDYIEALVEDSRVTAIGIHIEGISDVAKFSQAAKKALTKGIPIVALKTGTSTIGSELTLSHTSSLAGPDELYQTLFKRLNICRVTTLSSFLETLKLFSITGPIYGRNLGILTCSGGDSTLSADMADLKGFKLPKLNEEQVTALRSQMPDFAHISNPLDYNTSIWGDEQELERCFTTMVYGPFDVTILILDFLQPAIGNVNGWIAALNSLIKVRERTKKPIVIISILPEGIPESVRGNLVASGITPLQGIADAFLALDSVTKYYQKMNTKMNIDSLSERFLVAKSRHSAQPKLLDEWESKQELATFGLRLPKAHLFTQFQAEEFVPEMEGPYVVKAISPELPHKTEMGAVILNVKDVPSVLQAMEKINERTNQVTTNKKFLVEEMITNAVAELVIGLKRDEQFGLTLVIGTGGILVNLLNDSSTVLLPTNDEEIRDALYSLKGFKLLDGFRGRPKGDLEGVVQAVKAVAAYAEAYYDRILEMDVNPLLVLPEGEGAVAADALIRLAE